MTFQDIIMRLNEFWGNKGCLLGQPYPGEVGAGTFNPLTFFKVLGPKPWKVAYVELSKRPKDGRYAENPNRLQAFHQYQVVLKPVPPDVQDIYLRSIVSLGIDLKKHDVRFVEDDWESEALAARGLGWEVWLDGMEITQFTYFQEIGGIELNPVSVELTYGLGRIAMIVQKKDSIFEVEWAPGIKYKDLYRNSEYEFCKFNFDEAGIGLQLELFDKFEREAKHLFEKNLLYPGYDYLIKCSHILNILDARRAVSPEERKNYIAKIRRLANLAAKMYLQG
ncbi:glycine--tRNA ligase subunit alpha [candidate division WOR-3 bacterium]|nr:glycine--tRNA ligase subunit alpha [candidate division WOR-3 bacterium]